MIALRQLKMGYGGTTIGPELNGVFERGTMTAITGDNGCGKTTLIKHLAGVLKPVGGEITWQPQGRPLAWLPQLNQMDRQFPMRVQDVVAMGCWPRIGLLQGLGRAKAHIDRALEAVGLPGLARQPIETLSGGQFQRMLFARLIVQDARTILLDEPFTGVDQPSAGILMSLINQMHSQGKTIIAVLHDDNRVARFFPQKLHFSAGTVFWGQVASPEQEAK